MAYYVDTSALVKLVVKEPESGELHHWIALTESDLVTSDLTRTEFLRAIRRGTPERMTTGRSILDSLVILTLTAAIFDAAARLSPESLRSLDALHLAAALELGDDLEGIVTYDARMAEAAQANGVLTVAP